VARKQLESGPWKGEWSMVFDVRDRGPKRHQGGLEDLCQHLQHSAGYRKKEGPAFVGAVFKKRGRRRKSDLEAATVLPFDLDHGADITSVAAGLESLGLLFIAHTTWSDGVPAADGGERQRRCRLYFPLARSLTKEIEHGVLWAHIAGVIEDRTGCAPDRAARDITRASYTLRARHPESDREPIFMVTDGQPLDPDDLPGGGCVRELLEQSYEAQRSQRARPAGRPSQGSPGSGEGTTDQSEDSVRYCTAALAKAAEEVADACEGQRNDTLNTAAFSIGQLVGAGALDRTETEETLLQAAVSCGLPEPEARSTIASGLDAGVREPRDLSHIGGRSRPRLQLVDGQGGAEPDHLDLPFEPGRLFTDTANGERLVHQHGENFKYVVGIDWLWWDDRRWVPDETSRIRQAAKATARRIYEEAALFEDNKAAAEAIEWAKDSHSMPRLKAMIEAAKTDPAVSTRIAALDQFRELINLVNGTLDLPAGKLRAPDRGDLITRLAGVEFDAEATCPLWEHHLDLVLAGCPETIAFFQRSVGSALTGSVDDQCFFTLWGEGRNGKSVTAAVLLKLFGDYGYTAPFSTFLKQRNSDSGPRPELVALRGRRLVVASEPDAGATLSTSTIKQVTGGDSITARDMYKGHITFAPECKIFLLTNHKPRITDQGYAIWRRVKLIPFRVIIPDEKLDKNITAKLLGELPGILNWAIAGYREWRENGLGSCPEVDEATEDYKEAQDPIAEFLGERCVLRSGADCKKSVLRQAYVDYCEEAGLRPLGHPRFKALLEQRGVGDIRRHGGERYWLGIELRRKFGRCPDYDVADLTPCTEIPTGDDSDGVELPTVEDENDTGDGSR